MNSWNEMELGKAIAKGEMAKKIVIGKVCKLNAETISSGNVPDTIYYLDTSSITNNKIKSMQLLDRHKAPFPSRAKRKVKKGTIIYSTVRPNLEHFGYLENPDENLIVSTGFVTIDVIDEELDPKFLYYSITRKHLTDYLHTIAANNVSSYPSINPDDIRNLELEIPHEKVTQQNIAGVLSSLDSKIELNNRINAELEVMAKTVYDYWFVQFDFPNAKGKPYKTSGGKMEYSKELKREIPKGWGTKKIEEFGEFKNGINYDPSVKGDTDAKIINVRNISSSHLFVSQYDLDTISLERENVNNYLVTEKDILIARSGIPGATRMMFEFAEDTIYCGFIIRFQVKSLIEKNYLFYFLKNMEKNTTSKSGGTIMPNVNQDTLKRMLIVQPDEEMVSRFNNFVNPIFSNINTIIKENQKLSELRDWLLPMLMNGQVKVS